MRKNFNLPDDVIKYLEKQDNMSAYLTRLIRADMEGTNLEDTVKAIIKQMMDNKNTLSDKRV